MFQPIAAMLAVLLAPSFSWFESTAGIPPGASAGAFQASAQIVVQGCGMSRGNLIIQQTCVNGTSYDINGDLTQLESDAVSAYLTEHNLPASDAGLVYSEGRTDLRNAIRGNMMALLLAVISKPASARTQHETMLYNWMQALIQQNEIAEYQAALAEYKTYQANPCNYALDPAIAAVYGLSYNGPAACEPASMAAAGPPFVPSAAYFTAVGLEKSYGKPSQTTPDFGALVSETGISLGATIGIAAAVGTFLAGATGGLTAAFSTLIFPYALAILDSGVFGAASVASVSYVASVAGFADVIAAGSALVGPPLIIFVDTIVGAVAVYQVYQNQQNLDQLNNLPNLLAQAENTPPDLNAFATDTTGLGITKLTESLVAQTLPDVPSTAPLPAHNPGDPVFVITPGSGGAGAVQNSFSYDDWNGIAWQATTSGGWFDLTCQGDSSGKNCPQTDSFDADIHFVGWSGVNRIASRFGSNFVISKASPASTDKPCPADPKTGLTPAMDVSNCSSYVSSQIQYTYQGNQYTMKLTNAPGFSSATTIYFSLNGSSQTAAVTAVGIPTPAISLASGSTLPADVGFSGSNSQGIGNAQFTFSGSSSLSPGTYQVTLQAANNQGTTTQTFTLVFAAQLQIIMPSLSQDLFGLGIGAFYGQPVSFAVYTTGVLPIQLSITPGFLPPGWTFRDNGNGTATISGTTTAAGLYPNPGCLFNCTPAGSITATGPQGSVSLAFNIFVDGPPNPTITSPTNPTFIAGVYNSFELTTAGPQLPAAIGFNNSAPIVTAPVPSWLTLKDNGNGTATLSGTPPSGTSGPVFLQICAETVTPGWSGRFFCGAPNFQLNINDQPVFVNGNTATFSVNLPGSFTIATNQPSGSITEIGALPQGLEFTDNGNGTATISGTPAAGSGGVTTIQLSITGDTGTGTQALNVQVNEKVAFISASWVNFYVGQENSFPVQVSGYPLLSSIPAAQMQTATNYVLGAIIGQIGLPSDLSGSNLNPAGYNTGTFTISGNPSSADVGQHTVIVAADNGIDSYNGSGSAISQVLTLNIAVPGDVNGDGVVSCTDLDTVKASFGKYRSQPGYNPVADLNNDGVVNIDDLAIVARHVPKGTACH